MCGPMMLMGLLGAGVSAAGSISAANAQADAQKEQAKMAYRQAHIESAKGGFEAQMQERRFKRTLGSQTAAMGTSGVHGGTFEEVAGESARENALQTSAIAYNAEQQQQHQIMQGDQLKAAASNTKRAGMFSAASALIQPFTSSSNLGSMFNYG